MLKNLIRLRLLEFFELTAAIGGALYVWKYGDWYEWDASWVLGAVGIAAFVCWIATRIGKAPPIPGLFIATYAGALYGLSDLSPWMAIFGRLSVIDATLKLFPQSSQMSPWKEHAIIVALITVLMLTPAILLGCTWAAAWTLIQIARKAFEAPTSFVVRAALLLRFVIAASFISGMSYLWLRPQIRHVRTVRIPIAYQRFTTPGPRVEAYEEAPSIRAWHASSDGRLWLLYSDMRLVQTNIGGPSTSREFKIPSSRAETLRRRPVAYPCSFRCFPNNDYTTFRIWIRENDRVILHRDNSHDHDLSIQSIDLANLSSENLLEGSGIEYEAIEAISPNAQCILFKEWSGNLKDPKRLVVWDTMAAKPVKEMNEPVGTSARSEYAVSNDGQTISVMPERDWQTGYTMDYLSLRYLIGRAMSGETAITNDAKWVQSDNQLFALGTSTNLLKDYRVRPLAPQLDVASCRVVLVGELAYSISSSGRWESSRLPIIEKLLYRAHCGQLTLFDPNTKQFSMTWLRLGIFRQPNVATIKFTPDGRYLIIQDEDASADLFHIFSMP
jgi:hypothetical protein